MKNVWIKPACCAPKPSSVCGMSPAALKVLAALRATYSPGNSFTHVPPSHVSETLPSFIDHSYMPNTNIRPETRQQPTQNIFEINTETTSGGSGTAISSRQEKEYFHFLPVTRREDDKESDKNSRTSSPFSIEADSFPQNVVASEKREEKSNDWDSLIRIYTSTSALKSKEQSIALRDITSKNNTACTSHQMDSVSFDFEGDDSFALEVNRSSQDIFEGEDRGDLIQESFSSQCISGRMINSNEANCDVSLTQDQINKNAEDFNLCLNKNTVGVTDSSLINLSLDEHQAENQQLLHEEYRDGMISSPILMEDWGDSFLLGSPTLQTPPKDTTSKYLGNSLKRTISDFTVLSSSPDFTSARDLNKLDENNESSSTELNYHKQKKIKAFQIMPCDEEASQSSISDSPPPSQETKSQRQRKPAYTIELTVNTLMDSVDETHKNKCDAPSVSVEKQQINTSTTEEPHSLIRGVQNRVPGEDITRDTQLPEVSLDVSLPKPKDHATLKKCSASNDTHIQIQKCPLKKKTKFQPPLKKVEARPQQEKVISQPMLQADDLATQELVAKITSTQPIEVTMTIMYKDGFCQLNKPQRNGNCSPSGLSVRLLWHTGVQYIYLGLDNKVSSRQLLQAIFAAHCRKISFEAQETFMFLIDKMDLKQEERKHWLVLDPLVACWMLQPDNAPQTFKDVLTFLQILVDRECNIPELLSRLSLSTEYAYNKLQENQLWKLFLHMEMRITPILAYMELRGIHVNAEHLRKMSHILQNRLQFLQKAAHNAVGKPFQLTSPEQLRRILYDELKLDTKCNITVKGTEKRGAKSTSSSVLHLLKNIHPLPGIVLDFRHLHKIKSTYVDAMLSHIIGDSIFTTWEQTSAATGRIASSNPNMQAVPKQPVRIENEQELLLRSAYVARPGYSFLAADFQHIELRVFAHLSNDPVLINALSKPNDIFRELGRRWLRRESVSAVDDEDREKTKRIVYAVMYGAGSSKLSEFLQVDQKEASAILSSFKDMFPGMQRFSQHVAEQCRKQGYVATESGRRRWLPHINDKNTGLRLYAERQAVNFLIQGTAADLCKSAMVQSEESLAKHPELSAQLLLQIHDELLWEVPDCHIHAVADAVQQAMEEAANVCPNLRNFSVPLPVIVTQGKCWANMQPEFQTTLGPLSQEL